MAMLRRMPAALLLPWLLVAGAGCSSTSSGDGTADDGSAADGTGSGGAGGGGATTTTGSAATTSTGSSSSSGCVEAPPKCETDDRADETCTASQDDCYAVTACTTIWCRTIVDCSSVEGSSDMDGEEVTVDEGQACAVEGEVCEGISDSDGVAHCLVDASCSDGFWVTRGACEQDPDY